MSKSINLTQLALGKLPDRVIDSMEKMELCVREVAIWEDSKPRFQVAVNERAITIEMRLKVSAKKSIAILTGAVGLLCTGMGLLLRYAPILLGIFNAQNPNP